VLSPKLSHNFQQLKKSFSHFLIFHDVASLKIVEICLFSVSGAW
jgi:hypothetical protein